MGEAGFYLKARFRDARKAEMAAKIARCVFDDLVEFHNDWQKIRGHNDESAGERHEKLPEKHPLVAKFIRLPEPEDDDVNMNYLAGKCEMYDDYELHYHKEWVYLRCECWHLASWDNIVEFMFKLGAVEAGWDSDEHMDPFDAVVTRKNHEGRSVQEFMDNAGKDLLAVIL